MPYKYYRKAHISSTHIKWKNQNINYINYNCTCVKSDMYICVRPRIRNLTDQNKQGYSWLNPFISNLMFEYTLNQYLL